MSNPAEEKLRQMNAEHAEALKREQADHARKPLPGQGVPERSEKLSACEPVKNAAREKSLKGQPMPLSVCNHQKKQSKK